MYTVTVRGHIMIAHSLPHAFFGPAANLHGATYVVDAEFRSKTLDAHNVVIDIGAAHTALDNILGKLNYQNLDELEEFKGVLSTTEYIARHIHTELANAIRFVFTGDLKITLGESHVAWASYEGPV